MYNIAFMVPSFALYNQSGSGGRIVWKNLKNDPRINARFCYDFLYYKDKLKLPNIQTNDNYESYAKCTDQQKLYAFDFYDRFLEDLEVKEKIVYISVFDRNELIIVSKLLNDDKEVVAGGTIFHSVDFNTIRQLLLKLGTPENKLEYLTIVKGLVTDETDLLCLMRKKEVTLPEPESFECMLEATEDPLLKTVNSLRGKVNSGFWNFNAIMLDSSCYWGKCEYCSRMRDQIINLKNVENLDDKTLKFIKKWKKENKIESDVEIRFEDSYFIPDGIREEIIKKSPPYVKFSAFSGVMLLQDPEYAKMINELLYRVRLGLETTSEFSLWAINKGYKRKSIYKAFDNIIKYFNKDTFLEIAVMLDLPERDEESVLDNYRIVYGIKNMLNREGFKNVAFYPNLTRMLPGTFKSNRVQPFIEKVTNPDWKLVSGGYKWTKYLNNFYNTDFTFLYPEYLSAYYRRGEDNSIIKSDLDILSKNLFDAIFLDTEVLWR